MKEKWNVGSVTKKSNRRKKLNISAQINDEEYLVCLEIKKKSKEDWKFVNENWLKRVVKWEVRDVHNELEKRVQ